MPDLRTVCVYAGSRPGARPAYASAAAELGRTLAARGLGVVYGGGRIGLMGALADAALDAGAHVTGVIPRALVAREEGHRGLSELCVVGSMHERKREMADRSDAFVALPGGIGTLEELVEVLTWTHLGVHRKPCALLDVDGYYRPLAGFLDHAVAEGFLTHDTRAMLLTGADSGAVLDALAAWEPPPTTRWIDRDET